MQRGAAVRRRSASSTANQQQWPRVVVLVLRSATWLSYQTGVPGTRFSRCYAAVDARDARSGARAGSLSSFNCNRKSKASSLWGTGVSDRSSKNRRRSPTSSQIARVWISLQVQEPGSGIPSSPYPTMRCCHYLGFQHMMPNTRLLELRRFTGKGDPFEAARALSRLEAAIPKEHRHDLLVHAAGRMQLIDDWWTPSSERAIA